MPRVNDTSTQDEKARRDMASRTEILRRDDEDKWNEASHPKNARSFRRERMHARIKERSDKDNAPETVSAKDKTSPHDQEPAPHAQDEPSDKWTKAAEARKNRSSHRHRIHDNLKDREDPYKNPNAENINEMIASPMVAAGLREAGIPLTAFSRGEIAELNAKAADGQLFEDPDGVNLQDKLTLSADEVAKRKAKNFVDEDNDGINDEDEPPANVRDKNSFVRKLNDRRMRKIAAIITGEENEL